MMRNLKFSFPIKLKKWFILTNTLLKLKYLLGVQMAATILYLGKQAWKSHLSLGSQTEKVDSKEDLS